MGSGAGILTLLAVVLLLPLALLARAVGRRTTPRTGRWFAALVIGLPLALLVGWLATAQTDNDRPRPDLALPTGNPYAPETTAHDRWDRGRDEAAALTRQGKGPGSGMADDVARWCEDHVKPSPNDDAALAEATLRGCAAGAT
ncbi:hypothetical protein [Streptomyces sp. NPDC047123]|uniref:hypothetical protein n=1 Tax=Streptomyces sp. NPDC047123 TaxID=3155622 RepID=UPI00340BB493